MRRFLGILIAAALGGSTLAQAVVVSSPRQEAHLAEVRSVRTARFFEAWDAATEEARATVRALLADASGGAPLGARPSLATLGVATRILTGGSGAADDELAAFADSIDLQVRPGMFGAVSQDVGEGVGPERKLGDSLTVRVYRIWNLPRSRDVEIELHWVGPAGERIRARREPFAAKAFHGRGFDMYVRAPLAKPGLWHLEPTVHDEGRSVRGPAVPVPCVPELAGRVDAALSAPFRPDSPAAVLEGLMSLGLRCPELPGASLLDAIEGSDMTWSSIHPGLDPPRSVDEARDLPRVVGGFLTAERRGALVFLWSAGAEEELPWSGPLGDAWRELARENHLGLFVLAARAGQADALREALDEVARAAGAPPILVARATSVTTATMLFVANGSRELALGGMILATPSTGLPRVLPSVPICAVVAGTRDEPAPAGVQVTEADPLPLLGERALPRAVAEFLALR